MVIKTGGLIPAHAGKTKFYEKPPLDWEAHPRSRGENSWCEITYTSASGSSPLTRGKLLVALAAGDAGGLIPAHAGKTIKTAAAAVAEWGSSPLTRGKRHCCASCP